jgi:rhamnulokinase
MSPIRFLAFDLGAESGRAVLGTLSERKLALEELHRFTNPTGVIHGHLHWNLLAQWEELKTGLRKAAQAHPGEALAAIGIDTWGVDFGLLVASGEVLANPLVYRDSATEGMMPLAFSRVSRAEIFQATGIQFSRINTLYQILAMRQRRSHLLDAAQTLLFMPDLFNYLLCGSRQSEMSIASTSQMYDPRRGQWATEMLEKLDIPVRLLAPIVPSGTKMGMLLPNVAAECAIAPAPIIAPGCHDTASAVAAAPVSQGDSWCFISSGTWSLMGVEIDQPIVSDKALQYNYTNEMGVGPKVRFLKNIMGLWLVQECRRHWKRHDHDHSYNELTEMASRAQAFGPLVDPNHDPFLSPGDMPDKIDRFCEQTGQRAAGSRGEHIRACLESLALAYRRTLAGLEDVTGKKIKTIHILGGGSQNKLLNQMTADACGRPVIAGPVEATAIGNILVQAMAVGQIKSLAEARGLVRENFEVSRFEPTETRPWDAAYERFLEIVEG